MRPTTVTLLTIIAEGLLRERLIDDVMRLGASGYTLSEVHGRGTRGIAGQFWHGAQVRIEALVGAATADSILAHLETHYFADYSVIAYTTEVRVLRADKYT